MALKTWKTVPPGGWIFRQTLRDNTIKKFDFSGPVAELLKKVADFRKGNGYAPFDIDSIAAELDQQTCERLGNNPAWCTQKKTNLLQKLASLPAHVQKAVELAENVTNGARILSDWLGDGAVTVARDHAQKRANVCIGCPKNTESHGVMQLTDSIAAAILEQRRKKSDMGIHVDGELELFTCSVCLCHISLLVHVPIDTIAERSHPKLDSKYPEFCWKRKELEAFRVSKKILQEQQGEMPGDEQSLAGSQSGEDAPVLSRVQSNQKKS